MTGSQMVQFGDAVTGAFNINDFKKLLLRLNRQFDDYAPARLAFPNQIVELLAIANSEGWIPQLITEVIRDRPKSQAIRDFLVNNPNWDPALNPPLTHPCDALHVLGGKSFIGRFNLRKFLKK